MEVHFTPEQESRIAMIAIQEGTDAEQVVKAATTRMLDDDARFRAAVQEGLAAAERGDFVEHDIVWANVESILNN